MVYNRVVIEPLQLAQKPTPINVISFPLSPTSLQPISSLIKGEEKKVEDVKGGREIKIHIKRDDLTGLLNSGNKIRKLEYLLADALNKKCDCIITAGAIQSNHIRTTMFTCAAMGIKAVAVLCGEPPAIFDGNLLLDYLFGAEIHFLPKEEYDKRKEEFMQLLASKYHKQGYRPYLIPTGGSNGIGALGYLEAMQEMTRYIKMSAIDSVFCAVGSGGTYAGLLMGKYINGIEIPLYGILVDETVEYFTAKIKKIIEQASTILERKFKIEDQDIKLIDGYIGPGYGIPYPEEVEIIKNLALKGIILDPIYTGKAFYGMIKEKNKLNYTNPIFVHTGGIFSLFAYKEAFLTANQSG
jgi:D-cysteine desulfhydrase